MTVFFKLSDRISTTQITGTIHTVNESAILDSFNDGRERIEKDNISSLNRYIRSTAQSNTNVCCL